MVGASKILTVSYGTFSCTLEGFEDPFTAMKHIAEYFRDLAAEDRHFGCEPPVPDSEMLAALAERSQRRGVTAEYQDSGVILRPRGPEPAAEPEAPSFGPETAPEEAPAAETAAPEPAAPEPAAIAEAVVAETAPADDEAAAAVAGLVAAEAATAPEPDVAEAPEAAPPQEPEAPDAAESAAEEPGTAAEPASEEDAYSSIAAKLERLRGAATPPSVIETGDQPAAAEPADLRVTIEAEPAISFEPAVADEVEDEEAEALAGEAMPFPSAPWAEPPAAADQDGPATAEAAEFGTGAEADEVADSEAAEEVADSEAAEVAAEVEEEEAAEVEETDEAEATAEVEEADEEEAAEPVAAGRKTLASVSLEQEEAALARLLEATNSRLSDTEAERRQAAFSQLKAAVAATWAERQVRAEEGETGGGEAELREMDAYRDDLRSVTRAPAARAESAEAPLVLVSEQRIDEGSAEAEPATPVRPRRVTSRDLGDGDSFREFAERIGATSLSDLLEAAAAYTSQVEGKPRFSRAQVISKIERLKSGEDFSREAGLRSFGMLLREGRIRRVQDGQFTIDEESRFVQEARTGTR